MITRNTWSTLWSTLWSTTFSMWFWTLGWHSNWVITRGNDAKNVPRIIGMNVFVFIVQWYWRVVHRQNIKLRDEIQFLKTNSWTPTLHHFRQSFQRLWLACIETSPKNLLCPWKISQKVNHDLFRLWFAFNLSFFFSILKWTWSYPDLLVLLHRYHFRSSKVSGVAGRLYEHSIETLQLILFQTLKDKGSYCINKNTNSLSNNGYWTNKPETSSQA